MAYSLRLPDALDVAARGKAEYLGISINALICVALDAYLRNPGEPAKARSGVAIPQMGDRENPSSKTGDATPKLTRAEKQAIYCEWLSISA